MKYSKNILSQSLVNILEKKGVKDIVISSGSRNAPLIIGFNQNKNFNTFSIVDERCASFFALGLSKQSKSITALICTSGSALLNYYPAIAEAFYSNIPLLIISADRPKEKVNQGYGQTINQEKVFQNHILKSYQLSEKESKWYNERCINEALNLSFQNKKPIHINVPFSEPLYETTDKSIDSQIINHNSYIKDISNNDFNRLVDIWNNSEKKIILIGENYPCKELEDNLNFISNFDNSTLILKETTSNINGSKFIGSIDKFLLSLDEGDKSKLSPNLLIVLGGAVVSKKIKEILINYKIKNCWKFSKEDRIEDTYKNLTEIIPSNEIIFFENLKPKIVKLNTNYSTYFLKKYNSLEYKHINFLEKINDFVDIKVFDKILENIPKKEILHLSNSSIVRYSQLFKIKKKLEFYCNRGTSGIDGSTSTAIGFSVNSNKNNTLITGDISFFYDSNALWNNYMKNNFKIIILNNGGGNIFKIIDGPNSTKELETFFEAKHNLSAEGIASTFELNYINANNYTSLDIQLKKLWDTNKPAILEIFTDGDKSPKFLREYFKELM